MDCVVMTITKEWLAGKIKEDEERVLPGRFPGRTIGRVLLAIYRLQTTSEAAGSSTHYRNGVGFSKPDARTGTIGARMFASKGRIDQWVINLWSKPASDGFPRICKYVRQLNEIAKDRHVPYSEEMKDAIRYATNNRV